MDNFFEKPSPFKKYQCFVCGVDYETLEEMRAHVLEKHDEGSEYVSCPQCKAPVRCMKSHYSIAHPNRLIPKGIQTRVSIWVDFKNGKKKKKLSFRSGSFSSDKMKKDIHYRSGLECEIYELLEMDKDVLAYFAEPFELPYCHEGKWHKYIPDLKIQFSDGKTEIWEIKPANQTSYKKNQSKWIAMNEHVKMMGWDFTVITEVGVGKLKNKVKQQYNG